MKGFLRNYAIMLFACFSCVALAAAAFNGCGGGTSGTTTEDGADTSGEDGGEVTAADPVADALAKIAISAALNIGLGLQIDEAAFNAKIATSGMCGGPMGGTCETLMGETAINCPEDCRYPDGVCDASESAASHPLDCSCGNGTCDIYGAGETSATCPADCQHSCGDGLCSTEELFTAACITDCFFEHMNIFGGSTIPMMHGIPSYKCEGASLATGGGVAIQDPDSGEYLGIIDGDGICSYGHAVDGAADAIDAVFIDFEIAMYDVPIDGISFACVEENYDAKCMEGSAQLVFKADGSIAFYTALSGKLYAYREAPEALAKIVVGGAASGTLTLPPADVSKTCVDMTGGGGAYLRVCPERYRYGNISVAFDDTGVSYLESDGSVSSPGEETCHSFMIDWTLIQPDWWFGPPDALDAPLDEDGNGLAGCADPACVDHPACRMTYCDLEANDKQYNFHGQLAPAFCPVCGDGTCTMLEANSVTGDYCADDCDGNGECTRPEVSYVIHYSQDCCGDGQCVAPEDGTSCPNDCFCGDGICEHDEDKSTCPQDCDYCGNDFCSSIEDDQSCPFDCDEGGCGNGICGQAENVDTCPADCSCGDGKCDGQEKRSQYCLSDCCGDSIIEGTEECDDGNRDDGDGCDSDCLIE